MPYEYIDAITTIGIDIPKADGATSQEIKSKNFGA